MHGFRGSIALHDVWPINATECGRSFSLITSIMADWLDNTCCSNNLHTSGQPSAGRCWCRGKNLASFGKFVSRATTIWPHSSAAASVFCATFGLVNGTGGVRWWTTEICAETTFDGRFYISFIQSCMYWHVAETLVEQYGQFDCHDKQGQGHQWSAMKKTLLLALFATTYEGFFVVLTGIHNNN